MPDHLRISFAIRPDDAPDAEPLATGKDLAALQTELAPRLSRTLAAAASALTRTGATRWEFGTIADQVQLPGDGHAIVGYPALVDEGTTVGLTVLDTPAPPAGQPPGRVCAGWCCSTPRTRRSGWSPTSASATSSPWPPGRTPRCRTCWPMPGWPRSASWSAGPGW